MIYYVYMHLDPTTREVRYVGVGPKSRAYDWQGRGAPHLAWIAELDVIDLEPLVSFPGRTRDRDEAFEVERQLIKWHRHYGSRLFNITAGGMGSSGVTMSDATKKRMRDAKEARWIFDPEFRSRQLVHMEKARTALAARNRSPEHIAKIKKHEPVVGGSACKKCGGRLRYKVSRNCVNCARRP